MKYSCIVPIFLLASVSIANSADIAYPLEPMLPPVVQTEVPPQWNGPYVGVLAGYGIAKGEFDFCCYQYTDNFLGGRIGGFAGYNWQLSRDVFVGIEADIARDFNGITATASEVGTGWSKSVRLRVGKAQENKFLFMAGGWTQTDIFERDFDQSSKANGWTIGAGIDWGVSKNMFIRTEYRYNDFKKVELAGIDTDFSQNVLHVGIGFRF